MNIRCEPGSLAPSAQFGDENDIKTVSRPVDSLAHCHCNKKGRSSNPTERRSNKKLRSPHNVHAISIAEPVCV